MQRKQTQSAAALFSAEPAAVVLRPLVAGDAAAIHALHQRLSPTTVYDRYLQYRQPALAEITAICRLVPSTGAGFVAVAPTAPTAIIGVAYYVREPASAEPTAEPGILIEDRFQEQGIGRTLWRRLQHQARLEGLHWLRVHTHPHNVRMARLIEGSGQPYAAHVHSGLREYLVALATAAPHPPGQPAAQPMRTRLLGQWRTLADRLTLRWHAPHPEDTTVNNG